MPGRQDVVTRARPSGQWEEWVFPAREDEAKPFNARSPCGDMPETHWLRRREPVKPGEAMGGATGDWSDQELRWHRDMERIRAPTLQGCCLAFNNQVALRLKDVQAFGNEVQ